MALDLLGLWRSSGRPGQPAGVYQHVRCHSRRLSRFDDGHRLGGTVGSGRRAVPTSWELGPLIGGGIRRNEILRLHQYLRMPRFGGHRVAMRVPFSPSRRGFGSRVDFDCVGCCRRSRCSTNRAARKASVDPSGGAVDPRPAPVSGWTRTPRRRRWTSPLSAPGEN